MWYGGINMTDLKKMDINKASFGYKFRVTYNDTDKFFVFKDKYYKTEKSAMKFITNLQEKGIGMYSLHSL